MLNTFETILFSFRLVGIRYALLIFLSISLTLGLLLFAQDVLKGYEKSLLVKIIGSTAHVAVLFTTKLNNSETESVVTEVKKHASIDFTAKGLGYFGASNISIDGIKNTDDNDWEHEELKSQSPEVFLKGMVYTKEYAKYLKKVLISFDQENQQNTSKVNIAQSPDVSSVEKIYIGNNKPEDWDGLLTYRKPVAFPPSLYREIIDPYIKIVDYLFIQFTEAEKYFGTGNRLNDKNQFVVVSTLNTPVSDETIPIVTAYETIKYLLNGDTKSADSYNYLEFFLLDPMDATKVSNELKLIYKENVQIFAWPDKYASEMAIIKGFHLLLFSVMMGTGISIGLLLSSLLDITVRRKRRQLSILLSMGASERFVLQIFIYYSLYLGFVGFVAGVLLANILEYSLWFFININESVLAKYPYVIQQLHMEIQGIPKPVNIGLYNYLTILSIVLLICFISSYGSAIEGAKINPIEGLKES